MCFTILQVGLDGCGKSTVAHLASFIAGCDLFKLTLFRGYSTSEFRDDLKKVFLQTGVKGDKMIFLLTDSDIVKVCTLITIGFGNSSLQLYEPRREKTGFL